MSNRSLLTPFRRFRRARGAGIVEFLVVAPLLILLGLGLVQTGMVFHAKSSLDFALQEGARLGSVSNGDVDSIGRGIRDGLVPFMGGGRSDAEVLQTRARVEQEFAFGSAAGWIRVRQLSPTQQSFDDWAVDAFDEQGNAIREIPNSSLAVLRCAQPPNGGAAGRRASTACPNGGEPIGASSQQTLSDANLLKLNLTYGVKLSVPVVNRLVAGVLSMAAGCRANVEQRVGVLNLGDTTVDAQPDHCAFYNAVDAQGRPAPRIPVNLSVTVRMQSPARFAGNGNWFARQNRDRDPNSAGQQLGNGEMLAATEFAPRPVSQINPRGVTLANDQFYGDGNGSLDFGADTDWSARLASNTPGPGGNEGEEIVCEPASARETPDPNDGFFSRMWTHLQNIAGEAWDFVRGFWEGMKTQIGGIVDMVTDPIETARGIYELAMSFIDDPEGTVVAMGEAIGKDLSSLVNCGSYDRGRLLGENVSPAFMLRVATKLARFGRAGLGRALADTRRSVGGCSSFVEGTLVATPDGLVPIETITAGQLVRSRDDRQFGDAPQRVTATFNRSVPHYRSLVTERDTVKVTDEHPVWVQGRGWTEAKDVSSEDVIATSTGDAVVVANEEVKKRAEVYNFSVDSTPTYFVEESGLWVHNAPCAIAHANSTGRNRVLNRPEANTRYYVDNRHAYQTDELRRTTYVRSRIEQNDLDTGVRNCYQQRQAGLCGLDDDDGGHLIGTKLGGPGERINLVPQNFRLNRGQWREMEREWAEHAANGGRVDVEIDVQYPAGSPRPDQFIVRYRLSGGEEIERVFLNEAPLR